MASSRQLLAKERASLQDARRVVVKVGTHSIATPTGRPDYRALRRLVAQLCEMRKAGIEVIFVSSGAYERLFASHDVKIGQVLLTHADFDDRRRAANLRRSLDHLVRAGIVPVINENDIVADEELKGLTFGDNDWLSSLIVKLVRADALVLLTTVDGLLDAEGRRVPSIGRIRDAMKLVHAGQKGALSKGGMDSKLKAVQNAAKAGAHVVIANAATPHVLTHILSGRDVGTFVPGSAL